MPRHFRTFVILSACVIFFGRGLFAQEPEPAEPGRETKLVDFRADTITRIQLGDSAALVLKGHVVFFHNEAVITCDSAIRYSERRMECFRNVIINKDSTYIYGDRADYNGHTNVARVYAPIVKMIDQDAVLYTYNFSFNTKDEIGRYSGGGTMSQKDNMLESDDGYYYTSTREMICVGNVEMRNADYVIKSDSVNYNLDTEIARFHTLSYIWNEKDEMLSAYLGEYDTNADTYHFFDSVYIITQNQEIWADTVHFNSVTEDALLLSNVQIRDDEQYAMAFGDYVQYWGETEKALLTRDPSVLNFDPQEPDTAYIRADSMLIFTINRFDTVSVVGEEALFFPPQDDIAPAASDSVSIPDYGDVSSDDLAVPTEEEEFAEAEKHEAEVMAEEIGAGIGIDAPSVDAGDIAPLPTRRELRQERAQQRRDERDARLKERLALRAQRAQKPEAIVEDAEIHDHDHDHTVGEALRQDMSALQPLGETAVSAETSESAPAEADSVVREIRAYSDVRIYRSDFQAVCDSLVAFSLDSTIYMYKDPVMWNEDNQIKSDEVEIFTKNQKLDRILFHGSPMIMEQVDSIHFNQIKGRLMEAFFHEGQIKYMDVTGNSQTYYYPEQGDSTDLYTEDMSVWESAGLTFRFEDGKVCWITWKTAPTAVMYPLGMIPADQSQTLPGFTWEIERRPEKEDVFTRVIRPSCRELYDTLEKPVYPITEKIDSARKQLTGEGTWFDRNDRLSAEAEEFVRGLGY